MDDVRRLVIEAGRRHGLGGVAVGVVRAGEPPLVECTGWADHATLRPIDRDTVFRIASISKTLTAIGVMKLRDEGLLALDQPVNSYLKSIRVESPPNAPEVTIRHLLTHTSGIGEVPRVSDLWRREAWGAGQPYTAPQDLAELYRGALHTEIAAGTKWTYANHGFAILGQLVEDVSGRPFADYMREQVLRPLGMERADYARSEAVSQTLATGYHWVFGRFRAIKDYDITLFGAGSVLAPVADMLEYATWLAHVGRDADRGVMAPATLSEMMSPQYSVDPRLAGMGLAFFLDRFGTHRVCGHDGNNPGFASALLVAPDDEVGVVALTNTSSYVGAHLLAASVLRSILGVADPARSLPPADVPSDPHLWSELTGHYAPEPGFLTNFRFWQTTGGEVQVFVRDRRLHIRALSLLPQLRHGLELHPTDPADPRLFAATTDGVVFEVAFRAHGAGPVDSLCIGPPGTAILHRRTPGRSSRHRLTAAAGVAFVAAGARSAISPGTRSRVTAPRELGSPGSRLMKCV